MKDEEPEDTPEPDIQPVGQDYIEEIKSEDGKVVLENKQKLGNSVPSAFVCLRWWVSTVSCVSADSMIQTLKKCTWKGEDIDYNTRKKSIPI